MAVHQLTDQNFRLEGRVLKVTHSGNTLVFFKLDTCHACAAFEPIFRQIAAADQARSVTYAIINLTHYRNVINMAANTKTLISAVPHFILYVPDDRPTPGYTPGGKPHARYKGQNNAPNIQKFITDALRVVSNPQRLPQQSFVPQQQSQNMYGGPQQQGNVYMPDINPSRAATQMAQSGGMNSIHPSMQEQCAEDDEECLMMPNQIIPHNMPWESGYKKLLGDI